MKYKKENQNLIINSHETFRKHSTETTGLIFQGCLKELEKKERRSVMLGQGQLISLSKEETHKTKTRIS